MKIDMALSPFFKKLTLFELLVSILTILQLYHFCILFSNHALPMPLLYGPLFWGMYQCLSHKSRSIIYRDLLVGNFPFLFFLVWYSILGGTFDWVYFQWYLPVMILVQVGYPLLILYRLKGAGNNRDGVVLLKQLMALGMGISLFVGAVFIHHYLQIDVLVGINPIQAIAVAMVFSLFMLIHYMYGLYRSLEVKPVEIIVEDMDDDMDTNLLERCGRGLKDAMENDRLFLDSKLSLDKLSTHVGISKTVISHYLNSKLGLNYYEWLARYRINHAKIILAGFGSDYKIEAVAYSSGFSSKTTFNRYFKEIVGVLPSIYREQVTFS
ncbi:helix-turn-helix domain-containing protein [Sphingobacterium faecale]|uniref:AraC family transcriptional regulator n=1 Tax=Sphingobacterium faecale TaxID=2803775 RepID=A0ABS1R083_9SPHI|nr:helix-turn-helix domain-containing protein [Sphingobacterium faecale]MBL1408102.1 AraC family transcriptional regulator [Sphingobacterium faecale]